MLLETVFRARRAEGARGRADALIGGAHTGLDVTARVIQVHADRAKTDLLAAHARVSEALAKLKILAPVGHALVEAVGVHKILAPA